MNSTKKYNINFIFRIFDIFLSLIGIIILFPIINIILVLVYLENNSPLFCQERVGKNMKKFILIKFRTMKKGTNNCATHLVDPNRITNFGAVLRKTKLDELPQLWNVLKGDMSLVGPRPCLFNQKELIEKRKKYNIFFFKPGITGVAQIKGIDMSDPNYLAKTEYKMIKNMNTFYYFYYIFKTIFGAGSGDRIKYNQN